jgi:hypothetical protein
VKAVRFDRYVPADVLKVVDVPRPEPGPGSVLALSSNRYGTPSTRTGIPVGR